MHLSSICATLCLALAVPSVLALPKHKDPPPLPPGTEHGSYALRHNIHTLNELDPAVPCRNVSVIFARGSGNPGNIGKTAQFWDELAKYTGYDDLAVQGVNYWATIISYLFNLYGPGVVDTRERVKKLMVRCPDTSLVLAGYSQGAEVIRTYLEQNATQTEIDFVKTVALFGDPYREVLKPDIFAPLFRKQHGEMPHVGTVPDNKVLEFCEPKDGYCHGSRITFHFKHHRLYFKPQNEPWEAKHLAQSLGYKVEISNEERHGDWMNWEPGKKW